MTTARDQQPQKAAPSNLRPAPTSLTPAVADRLISFADRLRDIGAEVDRDAREAAARRFVARQLTFTMPLPSSPAASPGFAAELGRLRLSDQRPIAPDREPCVRCGTRGDLGCAHRRAAPTTANANFNDGRMK